MCFYIGITRSTDMFRFESQGAKGFRNSFLKKDRILCIMLGGTQFAIQRLCFTNNLLLDWRCYGRFGSYFSTRLGRRRNSVLFSAQLLGDVPMTINIPL